MFCYYAGITWVKAELRTFFKVLFTHNYKFVIWEITNMCNCQCVMCGQWQKKSKTIELAKAKELVDFMHKNNVVFIQLTGGEPLLYKDLIPLITYINKKGIIIQLATNGTIITKEYAGKLRKAGLKYICISLDHHKAEIHDSVRKYKGCFDKVMESIRILKKEGFVLHSSSVINKYNCNNLAAFVGYVNSLGISFGMCFPYPDFTKNNQIFSISENDFLKAMNELIELKKKGYGIINSYTYLNDCLHFINKEDSQYPCLAGTKVFALKINEFRACWMKKNLVFTMESGWKEQKASCNECQLACFRELSNFTGLVCYNKKILVKEIVNYYGNHN